MASGKSLELAQIKPQPSPKCTCGGAYKDHLKKDGTLAKRFDNGQHQPMAYRGFTKREMAALLKKAQDASHTP